jgi:hypothetical protein
LTNPKDSLFFSQKTFSGSVKAEISFSRQRRQRRQSRKTLAKAAKLRPTARPNGQVERLRLRACRPVSALGRKFRGAGGLLAFFFPGSVRRWPEPRRPERQRILSAQNLGANNLSSPWSTSALPPAKLSSRNDFLLFQKTSSFDINQKSVTSPLSYFFDKPQLRSFFFFFEFVRE